MVKIIMAIAAVALTGCGALKTAGVPAVVADAAEATACLIVADQVPARFNTQVLIDAAIIVANANCQARLSAASFDAELAAAEVYAACVTTVDLLGYDDWSGRWFQNCPADIRDS